jgi:hypothetical protein
MENVVFTIRCEMRPRWVPHFLGMLRKMQRLGAIGSSRVVSFYSDGDGTFRPIFSWGSDLPKPALPNTESRGGDTLFDAG